MANDCISRAAAISGIVDLLEMEWGYEGIREDVERIFAELPSVKPTDPKRGRWIWDNRFHDYTCSECNNWDLKTPNFCSNCGADMREVDDAEN